MVRTGIHCNNIISVYYKGKYKEFYLHENEEKEGIT